MDSRPASSEELSISLQRFFPLYKDILYVGIATIFPGRPKVKKLITESRLYHQRLILFPRKEAENPTTKLYFPANGNTDISELSEGELIFHLWFNESQATGRVMQFRTRKDSATDSFPWIRFAREGELDSFCFRHGSSFLSLDFCAKRKEFSPLYIKLRNEEGKMVSMKIEGYLSPQTNTATIIVRELTGSELPEHLRLEQPS